MSRLTRDGTAEPVSRDQILRHAKGQGNIHFPCSADHEQDWQLLTTEFSEQVTQRGYGTRLLDELRTRERLWECWMNRLLGQTLSVLPKPTAIFLSLANSVAPSSHVRWGHLESR